MSEFVTLDEIQAAKERIAGVAVRTPLYRVAYVLTRRLWPVLYKAFPQFVTTTERLGRALLHIAKHGTPKPILEARDINRLTVEDPR